MSHIKIVLLKDVAGVGLMGSVMVVKSGYARNFLLPNKLAAIAGSPESKGILKEIKIHKDVKSEKQKVKEEKKQQLIHKKKVADERKAKLLSRK